MHIRAPVLATLSLVAGLALALTTAVPAAWAMPHYTGEGGNTSTDVTGNSQGGYTATTTTQSGTNTTTQTSSTASNGSYTTSQSTTDNSTGHSQTTSTSYNGTTGTTTRSTTTSSSPGNSQTTTVTTDSSGNQTKTVSSTANGQTTSTTTVTAVANGTSTVQQGSMVILSTNQNAQNQDTELVNGVTVIQLPQPTPGESESAYQQTLAQWLQQNPAAAQEIKSAQLAVTTGGTGWVSSAMNQALADITGSAVLQLGGSNAVTGAQMLVQAANIFASSGLSGLESDLNTLASLSGGNGTATDPWAGSGYASNAGSGLAGVSLYQPPSAGLTSTTGTGGAGGSGNGHDTGGSTSCPAGDLGTPPNCYAPDLNPNPPANPQPTSRWYAIAVPAWMDSWLNVSQESIGSGDQTASQANGSGGQDAGGSTSQSYVPTDPAGAKALAGGPVAVLTDESAQVYGTYTVTTTEAETKYKTVTVTEQETRMVAETQTVPGYWHDVAVTEPGYYSTETVNHPGYYASQTVNHPGYYTTSSVNHPGYYTSSQSCSPGYYSTEDVWVDRGGRMERSTTRVWHAGSCTTHSVWHPGYTTTSRVWHAGYTTTEQVWHPAYTTTEQVWNPPATVMQAAWVPPTTETVEVPETYTAYVQEQQVYTVQVPVTETLTGWHTVTSQVAQPTVLTAAAALYVTPVNAQSDPWLE